MARAVELSPTGAARTWKLQICDDNAELIRGARQGGDGRPAVIGRGDLVALGAAEFGKQFPGLDLVIYNEHFIFGRVQ